MCPCLAWRTTKWVSLTNAFGYSAFTRKIRVSQSCKLHASINVSWSFLSTYWFFRFCHALSSRAVKHQSVGVIEPWPQRQLHPLWLRRPRWRRRNQSRSPSGSLALCFLFFFVGCTSSWTRHQQYEKMAFEATVTMSRECWDCWKPDSFGPLWRLRQGGKQQPLLLEDPSMRSLSSRLPVPLRRQSPKLKSMGNLVWNSLSICCYVCITRKYVTRFQVFHWRLLILPFNGWVLELRKGFFWNFKELFRQGALYRALPTALVGSVPKAVIHYSILNFYINALAPEGDMKKADGQTATMIGTWPNRKV